MGTQIWDPERTPEQGPEQIPVEGGANGYVLSMGTQIWDPERIPEWGPERTPERAPEMEKLTFGDGFSFVHFRPVLDLEMAGKLQSVRRKKLIFSAF